jgi:hypothetical protein
VLSVVVRQKKVLTGEKNEGSKKVTARRGKDVLLLAKQTSLKHNGFPM